MGDTVAWEGLWDVKDVARFLKVSRSWVYARADAGELPSVRVGGLLRFEPEAVRAFVHGQRSGAAARVLTLPPRGTR